MQDVLDDKITYEDGLIADITIDGLALKFTFVNGYEKTVQITSATAQVNRVLLNTSLVQVQSGSRDLITANVAYQLKTEPYTAVFDGNSTISSVVDYISENWSNIEFIDMDFSSLDMVGEYENVITPISLGVNTTSTDIGGTSVSSTAKTYSDLYATSESIRFYPAYKGIATNLKELWFSGEYPNSSGSSITDGPVQITLKMRNYNDAGTMYVVKPSIVRADTNGEIRVERSNSSQIGVTTLGRNITIRVK